MQFIFDKENDNQQKPKEQYIDLIELSDEYRQKYSLY